MPVFFIPPESIQGTSIAVVNPLFSHLKKSLRIRVGDLVRMAQTDRHRYLVRITEIQGQAMKGEIVESQTGPEERPPKIILGQALLKGEKMAWVIQKSTELGAGRIVPLLTERVMAHLTPDHARKQQERWQRIACEAAQQAERWEIPSIETPIPIDLFWETYSRQAQLNLILAERKQTVALSHVTFPEEWCQDLVLAIGPEGGWTTQELEQARQNGAHLVSFGPSILRAETAAIAAVCLVQARLGNLQ